MNKKFKADKPKRGLTVFFHFLQDNRPQCKRDHPEYAPKDVVKALTKKWHLMSDKEKLPYKLKAKLDQQNYWKMKNGSPPRNTMDHNYPKKGMCSFLHYLQAKREEMMLRYPNFGHRQIVIKLGEEWRQMTFYEKQPYFQLALNDQVRYEQDKKNFTFMQQYNSQYGTNSFTDYREGIDFVIQLPLLKQPNNN